MKTDKELKQYAKGFAEGFFYTDSSCTTAWEPFEHEEPREIKRECALLAKRVFEAMLWAQGVENG